MAKRIRVTADDVNDMTNFLSEGQSCGVAQAHDLSESHTVEKLYAMRRSAEPLSGGIVTAISTNKEPGLARNLKKAGFKKLTTFKNYSTGNTLTMWSAKVLRNLGEAVESQLGGSFGW